MASMEKENYYLWPLNQARDFIYLRDFIYSEMAVQ